MALRPVSMALTTAEKVARERPMTEGTPASEIPDYPYGLTLHLNTESLQKLGLNSAGLQPGQLLDIAGTAMVTGADAQMEGGMLRRSAELQIQTLGVVAAAPAVSAADVLFGGASGGNNEG